MELNIEQKLEVMSLFFDQDKDIQMKITRAALQSCTPLEDEVIQALYEHFIKDVERPVFLPTFVPKKGQSNDR